MELGIYHEFPVLPGRSQAECFAAGFDIVDAGEEYGLDVMWLAELHFDKRRALAASPLVLGTAIAARTERIRIGTSVQVLPLANPLRIAEEAATLDHVSKGRLIGRGEDLAGRAPARQNGMSRILETRPWDVRV
ncbi:MAG TPA: LLM class flavin-dependent oxidoreductase [Stellaceae bacterium]|nr:LLM class flavin-dependent oxidoreductase [Stellaceae bacterium]